MPTPFINIAKARFLQTRLVLGLDILVSTLASAFVLVLTSILIPGLDFTTRWMLTWLLGALVLSTLIFWVGKAYGGYFYGSASEIATQLAAHAKSIDIPAMLHMVNLSVPVFKSLDSFSEEKDSRNIINRILS